MSGDRSRGPADDGDTAGTPSGARVEEPRLGRPVAVELGLTAPERYAADALRRARAAAQRRGYRPGRRVGSPSSQTLSSPRADGRDPTLVGDTLARLAEEKGWRRDLSTAALFAQWAEVVGDAVAAHCTPEHVQDGVLTVRADSHTWMTAIRARESDLLARVAERVGEGVVHRVSVQPPVGARDWGVRGPRRVRGRGVRDTWD